MSSVLATRLTYGTPLLAGVLGLLAWDHSSGDSFGVGILAVVFGVGAVVEVAKMLRLGRGLQIVAALGVLTLLGLRAAKQNGALAASFEGELLLLALLPVAILGLRRGGTDEGPEEKLRRAVGAVFAVLYVGLPMLALLALSVHPEWGVGALIYLVLVVKGNDSGAYLVGRKLGKTPLSAVSPNKTREGAIGGLVLGTILGVATVALSATPFSLLGAIPLSLAIGVAGQLGDLGESALKRGTGVKDSGGLIPAFGGILDLLDSLLLAGPLLWAILAISAAFL